MHLFLHARLRSGKSTCAISPSLPPLLSFQEITVHLELTAPRAALASVKPDTSDLQQKHRRFDTQTGNKQRRWSWNSRFEIWSTALYFFPYKTVNPKRSKWGGNRSLHVGLCRLHILSFSFPSPNVVFGGANKKQVCSNYRCYRDCETDDVESTTCGLPRLFPNNLDNVYPACKLGMHYIHWSMLHIDSSLPKQIIIPFSKHHHVTYNNGTLPTNNPNPNAHTRHINLQKNHKPWV